MNVSSPNQSILQNTTILHLILHIFSISKLSFHITESSSRSRKSLNIQQNGWKTNLNLVLWPGAQTKQHLQYMITQLALSYLLTYSKLLF